MDGVQLSQGLSHFEEAVYFLPARCKKTYSVLLRSILVVIKYRCSQLCKLFLLTKVMTISCNILQILDKTNNRFDNCIQYMLKST